MSLTPSMMMPIGHQAPDFKLINTLNDEELSFDQCKGEKGTLVFFICNHCPYVVHVIEELVGISDEFKERRINTIAISSNDIINYPQDAPDKMKEFAASYNFQFPYLFDESQEVAKTYMAACTPDIYLFDSNEKCFYRGRMDESTPGNGKTIDGKDLREALNALMNGDESPKNQSPSQGCNIKWK
jgi:peroxiredoxin